MASDLRSLSDIEIDRLPEAKGWRFAVLVSNYHEDITHPLRDGAIEMLKARFVADEDILIDYVPGTYELTSGAQMLAESAKVDAIICLGCVIKGHTDHDKYINHAVAQGLTHLGIKYHMPVIFGVLTPNNHQQAVQRAGGSLGNKGHEAAAAAIEMVAMKHRLGGRSQKAGF
jgi:6,7-dimethyl-8-ribityllumazine synthase